MTTHNLTISASGHSQSSGNVTMSVIRFQESILNAARQIAAAPTADGPTFAAAVIIAQTACEVATERAMGHLIARKNLGTLGDAIEDFIWKHDLSHKTVRRLWTSLTGDEIQNQRPLWDRYQTHVKRRNKAAHAGLDESGEPMVKAKADDSIEVVSLFLEHVKQVLIDNDLGDVA